MKKPISEINKGQDVIEERKQQREDLGYWVCDKCETKYFFGHNCDPCMREEFLNEMKKLGVIK